MANRAPEVALEYFGWAVVIDERTPADMYVVDSGTKQIRMSEGTWHTASLNGIIEDVIDTLPHDATGMISADSPRFQEAIAQELADRPALLTGDRVERLQNGVAAIVRDAAAGHSPVELVARVNQSYQAVDLLREELAVVEAQLDLAARAIPVPVSA